MQAVRKLDRKILLDQAYDVLKGRILDRAVAPGQKLNIDALAREFQVSSTPIREALGRLAAEGLVDFAPFLGFAVAALPPLKFYADLYAFRQLIEPWAAAEAARRRDASALLIMAESVAIMREGRLSKVYRTFRTFSEADQSFHQAIFSGAGNQAAASAYEDLRVHLHMSRLYVDHDQDTEQSLTEHEIILSAVQAGEAERASQAMLDHLRSSQNKLLE